jgi:predicted PurR-regulated permease PerM
MPHYVMLISTLGDLAIFGLNGFVIGPVIAAMFMAAWDIFLRRGQGCRWTAPVFKVREERSHYGARLWY